MTQRADDEKFLRAAIKAGLRIQQRGSCGTAGSPKSDGVATLQRIKASLRKRGHPSKTNP